ncbi:MAG: competence type IV pilus minor pilin ComGG [Anaerobacillus sp.]
MTALMMLMSTLVLGFLLHLFFITDSERGFLNQEEEQNRKESLLVLGMKDTISYIQKNGGLVNELTFTYEEGTITAFVQLVATDVLQVTLYGGTRKGTRVVATFHYNQKKKQVIRWGEETG